MNQKDVRFFVGGDGGTIQGEPMALTGDRCFTAAIRPKSRLPLAEVSCLMDSGAFSDSPQSRLTFEGALQRQFKREADWNSFCGATGWHAEIWASYDRLIDETWVGGERFKRRWSLKAAESAVEETVEAARYLVSQRSALAPRTLLLGCQGVDAQQYAECAVEVLSLATSRDWLGLGGWCILGLHKRLLPEFWRTLHLVLPMAARIVSHVHIFGVMWPVALGGLLFLCDRFGLSLSTDSAGPIIACTYTRDPVRAGVRRPYWRDNVEWWKQFLRDLRESPFYCEPPRLGPQRQLSLWESEI